MDSALCAAVNELDKEADEGAAHVSATSYQTWIHLMKQVCEAFTDDRKRKFVQENGLKAVLSVKWLCKDNPEVEKAANGIWLSLL